MISSSLVSKNKKLTIYSAAGRGVWITLSIRQLAERAVSQSRDIGKRYTVIFIERIYRLGSKFYNSYVGLTVNRLQKLPVLIMTGSFCGLLVLALLTNPINQVGVIFVFFCLVLTFFISLGLVLTGKSKNSLTKRRYKITMLSIFVVILLMFRSTQSLGLTDVTILILTVSGLFFYISRKP